MTLVAPAESAAPRSSSTTIRLRWLRTLWLTGSASDTLTRATGVPSSARAASTAMPRTGLAGSATKPFAYPAGETFRRSTTTVNGSGRSAAYATGSLDSMSTAGRTPAVEVIAVSRGPVAAASRLSPAPMAASAAVTRTMP